MKLTEIYHLADELANWASDEVHEQYERTLVGEDYTPIGIEEARKKARVILRLLGDE